MSTLLFALRSLTKEYESSNETVSSTVALGQKIPGFEAGRKSAYLLFPKRGEKEKGREREGGKERERNTHVNALTGKTAVDANSERGSLVFSSQQPRGIRERRMVARRRGARGPEGSRAVETRTKSEVGSGKAVDRL